MLKFEILYLHFPSPAGSTGKTIYSAKSTCSTLQFPKLFVCLIPFSKLVSAKLKWLASGLLIRENLKAV